MKQTQMNEDTEIIAAQLAGDFTLPENTNQKLIFIAGGIGITPFRSMIQHLLDTHQRRPIALFYSNRRAEDIVYQDVFDRAEKELGLKVFYTVTDPSNLPANWKGKVGRFSAASITKLGLGYKRSLFYLSGPVEMIASFQEILHGLGIKDSQIKIDYFAGL
jgi:glycine betaine catabolism B